MSKRFTCTNKWQKKWFRGLSPLQKCFWLYLCDTCNHAGIWEVDFELASFFLGQRITLKDVEETFKKQYVETEDSKKWFIKDFVDFQYGELNPENRAHLSVINILKKEGAYKGLIRSLEGRKDKDKDKDKDKERESEGKQSKLTRPSLKEITDYCLERKNNVNPKTWLNHYQAKGWMIGKSPMKDWKAAIRTWEDEKPKGEQLADKYKPL